MPLALPLSHGWGAPDVERAGLIRADALSPTVRQAQVHRVQAAGAEAAAAHRGGRVLRRGKLMCFYTFIYTLIDPRVVAVEMVPRLV